MKTAWFFIYPPTKAYQILPVARQLGIPFLEKWLELSLSWQKRLLQSPGLSVGDVYIVLDENENREAHIRKLFSAGPSLRIRCEFTGPDTFLRKCDLLIEKYGKRYERMLFHNPETPLGPSEVSGLCSGEVDTIVSGQKRPLVWSEKRDSGRKITLPGLYDLRSVSDILARLASGEPLFRQIATDLSMIFSEIESALEYNREN